MGIDDARTWLRAQHTATCEQIHMLQRQFEEDRDELGDLVEQLGIELTGEPGSETIGSLQKGRS